MRRSHGRNLGILGLVLMASAACERPPVDHRTVGWRGIGMQEIENPRSRDADSTALAAIIPVLTPAAVDTEPMAAGTYENVQVLGNLSEIEFNLTMAAITQWVSPEEGCTYCHYVDPETGAVDMASDDVYTKVVSRQMFRMVKEINREWSSHVGDAGVSCYTCHQGQPVPQYYWHFGDEPDGLRHFLDRDDIRVQSTWAIASEGENDVTTNQTWYTYETMIHISNSLGVTCTYCHQSSRWGDWEESPPARTQALRGIRMVRASNLGHMLPLEPEWPAERRGEMGDGPKIECLTCHQERNVPQYGLIDGEGWRALHLPVAVNAPVSESQATPVPAPIPDGTP